MNQAMLRAPQEYSKAALALAPIAANGAQNGVGVDRTGYSSAIADVSFAISGAPTGGTVTAQLQDSADDVTFANIGYPVSVAVAASGIASVAADLSGARQYVRVVATAAPTGGNSPVATVAGTLRLYGPDRLPAL